MLTPLHVTVRDLVILPQNQDCRSPDESRLV
jgi:hypothetical protein